MDNDKNENLNINDEVLRLFVKSVPSPVAMFDTEMRYLLVSDRWLADYNLGDKNIIGMSHYTVFPNLSEEWKAIHRRCLAGETIKNDNDSFFRPDGHKEYLRWEVTPWKNKAGSIGGMIIFSETITKLRELEIELQNRVTELEVENKSMIGREIKMAELKKEIEDLKKNQK